MRQNQSKPKRSASKKSKAPSSKENIPAAPSLVAFSDAIPSTSESLNLADVQVTSRERLPTLKFRLGNLARPHHGQPQSLQDQLPEMQPRRVQPSRKNKGNILASALENMEVDDDATTCVPGRKRRRQVADDGPEDLADVPPEVPANPLAPSSKKKRKQSALPLPMPMQVQMPLHPPEPIQTWSERHDEIPSTRTGISGVSPTSILGIASVQTRSEHHTEIPSSCTGISGVSPVPIPGSTSVVHAAVAAAVAPRAIAAAPRAIAAAPRAIAAAPRAIAVAPRAIAVAPPAVAPTARQPENPGLFLPEPGWIDNPVNDLDPELDPRTAEKDNQPEEFNPNQDFDFFSRNRHQNSEDIYSDGPGGANHDDIYSDGPGGANHDDIYSDSQRGEEYWPVEAQIPDYPRGVSVLIDEESPDEEDARLMGNLRDPTLHEELDYDAESEKAVETRDVLAEHRRRNKAIRPPDEQRLLDAAHQQLAVAALDTTGDADEEGSDEEGEDSDSDGPRRARRHTKSKGEASDKDLSFYEGSWREALKTAKLRFRRYIIIYNGFPLRGDHLPEAAQIIAHVVEDMKQGDDGVVFDQATQQTRAMNCLVFKEASTYRSKMKNYCVGLVMLHYASALGLEPMENFRSQRDKERIVSERVQELIGEETSMYHFGPDDAHGKKSNLMHECIAQLCIYFYYGTAGGSRVLARLFPADFKDSVPEKAVAMAATCVYHCIDEYVDGYRKQLKFSAESYGDIYGSTLEMIVNIKDSQHHKEKWDQMRRDWARRGMMLMNPSKGQGGRRIRAVLD